MSFIENYQQLSNNRWLILQNIKKAYANNADNIQSTINTLCTDVDDQITHEAITQTIVGTSGKVYNFASDQNSDSLTISVREVNNDGQTYSDPVSQTISNFFSDGFDVHFDDMISGNTSLSSIINDINQSKGFSTIMVDVSRAFQSSETIAIGDILSLITTNTDAAMNDTVDLISNIKTTIQNGKLHVLSWLGLVKGMLQNADDSLADDQTLLDTTKPYIMQSSISFLLMQVVSSVIPVIAYAIRGVIGVILYAIYGLVSLVSSLISKVGQVATDVDVHAQSDTDWVNGPLLYGTCPPISQWPTDYAPMLPDLLEKDGVIYTSFGCMQFLTWSDSARKQFSNCFWGLGWNWRKAVKYMISSSRSHKIFHPGTSHGGVAINNNWIKEIFCKPEYYYRYEEVAEIMNDPRQVAYNLIMSLGFTRLFGRYMSDQSTGYVPIFGNHDISDTNDYLTNPSSSIGASLWYPNSSLSFIGPANAEWSVDQFAYGFYELWCHVHDHNESVNIIDTIYSSLSTWSSSKYSYVIEAIQGLYNSLNTSSLYKASSSMAKKTTSSISVVWVLDSVQENLVCKGIGTDYTNPACVHMPGILWYEIETGWQQHYIRFQVDSIPTDRAIDIPSISYNDLMSAILTVATITAAVTIAGVVTSKIVKRKQFKKQIARSAELNTLREAYTNNPTSDNSAALIKATRRYNFKAKIFGWNTYDAANGWFDSNDSAAVSTMSTINIPTDASTISTVYDKLMGNDIQGNNSSLKSISQLITGI